MGGKVIFSRRPKSTLEEVFDRKEEIEQLGFLLRNHEWAIILGPRMAGKTSLALAVSNSVGRRVVYVDLMGVRGARDLVGRVYFSMPRGFLDRIRENLELIGVRIGPTSLEFKVRPTVALETMMRSICEETIVVLDEAQELRYGLNHFVAVLHNLLNSCPTLSIIFTGSAIGLMRTLLNQKGRQPLAGRRPTEIVLKPWEEEIARRYLSEGLEGCGVKPKADEVAQVIREMGTLVGWLNIYGVNRCTRPHDHEGALRDAIEEAIGIALGELKSASEGSGWRIGALKLMYSGATWTDLLSRTQVSTETLSNFLNRLEGLFILRKEERNYLIQDPIYRRAVMRL